MIHVLLEIFLYCVIYFIYNFTILYQCTFRNVYKFPLSNFCFKKMSLENISA